MFLNKTHLIDVIPEYLRDQNVEMMILADRVVYPIEQSCKFVKSLYSAIRCKTTTRNNPNDMHLSSSLFTLIKIRHTFVLNIFIFTIWTEILTV